MKISVWRLSTDSLTVQVTVNPNKIIIKAAPVVAIFIRQPLDNLVRWMSRRGKLDIMLIFSGEDNEIR